MSQSCIHRHHLLPFYFVSRCSTQLVSFFEITKDPLRQSKIILNLAKLDLILQFIRGELRKAATIKIVQGFHVESVNNPCTPCCPSLKQIREIQRTWLLFQTFPSMSIAFFQVDIRVQRNDCRAAGSHTQAPPSQNCTVYVGLGTQL